MGPTSLPPGFRFRPTDEELVGYYLKRKVDGQEMELEVIPVIDLYKFDPWELPGSETLLRLPADRSFLPKRDQEWFFFCPRDKKYPNGSRTNRATRSGYWKATGKDRKVVCSSVATAALRKTLVFYRGRAPAGDRTEWVMHEYRLCKEISPGITNFVGAFALCHITKRNEHGEKAGNTTAGESRGCVRNATNASEDSPPSSSAAIRRKHGSSVIHVSPAPQCGSRSGTRTEPIVIDQDQMNPEGAESVVSYSPKDLPPVEGSDGWMLQDELQHYYSTPFSFPSYNPMEFSPTETPNMNMCEEAGLMMPCLAPMDYLDMRGNVRNPPFQATQWEESTNVTKQMSGLETWNLMFTPPICRQASGDGIGDPASQWPLDDSARLFAR
ncbi:hypothetical protein Taro_046201 [Colocasia esculenta]|uniref:NAC domain-containing protein n=1 Tax=Colocasia esculenta TaxID=4460 RepID=A0A843WYQ4_COLES|nr:hypothetical protein [Colocasia esculenta]